MKVWIKFLIGAIAGIIISYILPVDNTSVTEAVSYATEIVIRFGRYMLIPVVFFTTIICFNRLRDNHLLLKTGLWTGAIIVGSAIILTIVGISSILLVKLPRIPITDVSNPEGVSIGVMDLLRSLFPVSAFDSLSNGVYLLPVFFFACIIGCASTADPILFKPVIQLSDSLSKLMYNISVLFTEFLSFGMVAILTAWMIQYREVMAKGVYQPLILMLLIDFVIVVAVIYPIIIRYLCHDPHPYRILYASICSVLTAFFSGDANLVLQLNMRHTKESLGVRRRINGVVNPLFSIFARGGTALVTTIGFILIWRSYSTLSMPVADIVKITLTAFGFSFLLGGFPAGGAFITLTVLCTTYGKGFENGYLLLKPAAPIICSFATAFDAATAIFGTYIVGVKTKHVEHHSISHYI